MSLTEVAKECAEQWRNMSESEKEPYSEKAGELKEVWEKKMEKYRKSKQFKDHQVVLIEWKKAQLAKPFKKDPNRPKRGLSSFMVFCNEKRHTVMKEGVSVSESAIKLGEMWQELSDGKRAPYIKKAAKLKVDAQKAMDKYMKTDNYRSYMEEKEVYKFKQREARTKERLRAAKEEEKANGGGKPVRKKKKKKMEKKAGKSAKKAKGGKKAERKKSKSKGRSGALKKKAAKAKKAKKK